VNDHEHSRNTLRSGRKRRRRRGRRRRRRRKRRGRGRKRRAMKSSMPKSAGVALL